MPKTYSELNGYLNVLKPPGLTSHDVVNILRRLTGERRIGHTGTLDPTAVGVLPIALGRATPTVASVIWDQKSYWADVTFGARTDTDDATGVILETASPDSVSLEAVVAALPRFVGLISQSPPSISAIHVAGRRAYRMASRGIAVAPLPARTVHISNIEIVRWESPIISLRVHCQSGTYIRSLARDLGDVVGCPAHLSALVRLRVGPFDIRDALDLDGLDVIAAQGDWADVVQGEWAIATGMPAVILGREQVEAFALGRTWPACERSAVLVAAAFGCDGTWLGFADHDPQGRWQRRRRPGEGVPGMGSI